MYPPLLSRFMSLATILAEIEAATAVQITSLKQEAETEIQTILDEARAEAATQYEAARLTVVRPLAVEKAHRLYEARLAVERETAVSRTHLLQKIQTEAYHHLAKLRTNPAYTAILRGLIEEAWQALGTEETAQLVIDSRDEAVVTNILAEMGRDMPVKPTLDSWGGVIVQSHDGRITINNTLESRLEQAMTDVKF